MRKLVLAILLTAALPSLAATKPDPADFTINVHVVSSGSRSQYMGNLTLFLQVLETVIDNQPVELTGNSMGVLTLADYKARLSTSVHGPRNPNTFDIYKGYDLLMPDGTSRTYTVTRIGPAIAHP